jgi:hypothetical protein
VFVLQVTKKLAGAIGDSAAWMSNIGNEFGQVLNSVLTQPSRQEKTLTVYVSMNTGYVAFQRKK